MPTNYCASLSPSRTTSDLTLLVVGVILLSCMLAWHGAYDPNTYLGTLQRAVSTLRGHGPNSDIATDIVGFRALVEGRNAYPILGPALLDIGIDWDVRHASTHPPTTYLFVAPVAYLPWSLASAVWGWLMFALLVPTFIFCGLRPVAAVGLAPIALLWPPVATSLGQLTLLWLFCLSAAYWAMWSRPVVSGLAIGLASLTKFFPAILILLFLRKRLWTAGIGMGLVWAASLLTLLLIAPNSWLEYAAANQTNTIETIMRSDNSSLLAYSFRSKGLLGLCVSMVFILVVVFSNHNSLKNWRDPYPSLPAWMVLVYLSVALLPISWIYSSAPLLPVILFLLSRRRFIPVTAGLIGLAIPFFAAPWGFESVKPLVSVTLAVGVGLIAQARSLPFPFARSFDDLFSQPRA